MNRRCKVLVVMPEVLWSILKRAMFNEQNTGEVLMIKDAIPHDVELVRGDYDISRGMIRFLLSHDSFDEVPEGEMFPFINPVFEKVT